MPRHSPAGEITSAPPGRTRCHQVSTTGSGDCGNTTSLIARRDSRRENRRAPGGVRKVEIVRVVQSGAKPAFTFATRALGSLPDLATQDFPQMNIKHEVVAAVGNTPLIKLKRASEQTGCTILGKAEFMNPGQSVKDRAGKWRILEAERRGDLKPGGLVVESTAGNTGIGLA